MPDVDPWGRKPSPRRTTCSLPSATRPPPARFESTESRMSSPQGFNVEVSDGDGDAVRIVVRGELDMSVAPGLTDAITGASGAGVTVLLDMSGVTFLDSSAI